MSTWNPHINRRSVDLLIFFGAVLLVSVLGLRPFWDNHGDPTTLLRVGTYSASRSAVEADFADPVLTPDYGHDGQQFYVLAREFPHLDRAAGHVDRLTYRARRILLPAIVSPMPAGAPTVWAMFAVNVAAVGAAALGIAQLARRFKVSPLIGLVVAASPAMVESVQGSLGDALAFALCVWAVVIWRKHTWWAALLLTLAALSRETSLVVAVACLIVAPPKHRLPFVATIAAWIAIASAITVTLRTPDEAVTGVLGQFTVPFTALFVNGTSSPEALLGIVLIVGSLWAAWVLRELAPEISVWLVLDAAVVIVVNEAITGRAQNLARVAPMAFPAIVLAAAVTWRSRQPVVMAD